MNLPEYSKFLRSNIIRLGLFGIVFLSFICTTKAQMSKTDSIFLMTDKTILEFQSVSELDPNKAAFLSAILPGLGQAYNNQYWKIPLIYGGALIFAHYINYNNRIYYEMQNALVAQTDNSTLTENFYDNIFSTTTTLENNRDVFRRNRDFLIILTSAFYLLNVADAHISAHLNEFEVNENLSMSISPSFQSTPLISRAAGISISINFR
ncbi:MAG: hypothetical protein ACJA08_000674 [Cyclobacteriaceae bacterium]|jgi:hypothetical protein